MTMMSSLLVQLRDRKVPVQQEQLINQFQEVYSNFLDFQDHKECAEILASWSSKFKNITLTDVQRKQIQSDQFTSKSAKLSELISDRWVCGDPSFKLFLKKALQNIISIRNEFCNFDTEFGDFIKHTASYSQSDIRIAYGVLETIAKVNKAYNVVISENSPSGFVADSFFISTSDESRSGIVGRCLAAILGPMGPHIWFDNTKSLISDPITYQKVMTYFIEPVLKQSRESQLGFGKFYELCKPLKNPSIEIGILKAGKNAKIDVSEQIRSSNMIERSLTSLNRDLRYDSLRLLCNSTHKLSAPVPSRVYDLIIANASSLLAEGEPKSRADVCSAFRSLLIRVSVSKSDASNFIDFIARWCITNLCPGMPYRCLAMAGRSLHSLTELKVPILSATNSWHNELMTSSLNCVVSDFNDIREMAVNSLLQSPQLSLIDDMFDEITQEALKLMASSRNGEAGARSWQFLYSRKPEAGLAERALDILESRVKLAETDFEKAISTTRIHGFITCLRLTPPLDRKAVVVLIRRVCDLCTPPLTSIAPEGASEDLVNFCWKAIKESSLLIEEYASSGMIQGIDEVSLLTQLSGMLTDITHWGAFTAVAPAFVAMARRNSTAASHIVWTKIQELSSGSDSRSVTRRSAGLPLLITSYSQIHFDKALVDALFDLANLPIGILSHEEAVQDLEMSQVHGMNCIKAVITDAESTKTSSQYLSPALKQCLATFNSPTWSLRNCAAMLFNSLFKRFFGVRGLPVSALVFFQRYKHMKSMLFESLSGVTRKTDMHAVFPALAILGKLKPVTVNDPQLAEFWDPVIELLGSKSWKIRELAAQALKSMAHSDEIVDLSTSLALSLNLGDQNETHGFGLAIREVLRSRTEVSFERSKSELQQCQLYLSKAIVENCFMETSIVLYECYVLTGGEERLVPFKDLPVYQHLNRSLSVFEAEQVKNTRTLDNDPTRLLNGFAPVLEILPSNLWTLELARAVLLTDADKQLPQIRKACLQNLRLADHISWEERSELAFKVLQSQQAPSVREAAVMLLSYNVSDKAYSIWSEIIMEFSQDESPVDCRRSAVVSLQAFIDRMSPRSQEVYVSLRSVSDEEEDIRDLACRIVSQYFGLEMAAAPGKCAELIVKNLDKTYLAHRLTGNLEEKAREASDALTNSKDVMFVIEKESSYQDELHNALSQSQYCKPDESDRLKARNALKYIEELDFTTPLRANASADMLTVKAIVTTILAK